MSVINLIKILTVPLAKLLEAYNNTDKPMKIIIRTAVSLIILVFLVFVSVHTFKVFEKPKIKIETVIKDTCIEHTKIEYINKGMQQNNDIKTVKGDVVGRDKIVK